MSTNHSYQSIVEDVEINAAKSSSSEPVEVNKAGSGNAWRRMVAVAVLLVLGVLGYSSSSAYTESAEQLYEQNSPTDFAVYNTVSYFPLMDRPCRAYLSTKPLANVFADKAGKAYTSASPGQCAEFAKKAGYDFFGISAGGTCHAGDNYSATSKSNCGFACKASVLKGEQCGGKDGNVLTVSVYKVN